MTAYDFHKVVDTDRRCGLARTARVIGEVDTDVSALEGTDTRCGTRTGPPDRNPCRHGNGLFVVLLKGAGVAHGWHVDMLSVHNALEQEVRQLSLPEFEPRAAPATDPDVARRRLRTASAHQGPSPGLRAARARAPIHEIGLLEGRLMMCLGDLGEWWPGGALTQDEPLDVTAPDCPLSRRVSDQFPIKARLRQGGVAGASLS